MQRQPTPANITRRPCPPAFRPTPARTSTGTHPRRATSDTPASRGGAPATRHRQPEDRVMPHCHTTLRHRLPPLTSCNATAPFPGHRDNADTVRSSTEADLKRRALLVGNRSGNRADGQWEDRVGVKRQRDLHVGVGSRRGAAVSRGHGCRVWGPEPRRPSRVVRPPDRQIAGPLGRPVGRSPGRPVGRSAYRLVGRSAGRRSARSAGPQIARSAERPVGRSAGRQVVPRGVDQRSHGERGATAGNVGRDQGGRSDEERMRFQFEASVREACSSRHNGCDDSDP